MTVQAMSTRSKKLLRSLIVTSFLSFVAPLLLIGSAITVLTLASQIPVLGTASQVISNQILQFLQVFGNGDAIEGAIVIASACMLVGALFDAYSFYYSSLRNG